jgi:ribosomal protein S18 acetylase RimI-like enzyme
MPMTETEFQAYLEEDIQRYAEEHVKAGNWHPSEALEKSRREHQQLLPEGLASRNQYLFSIVNEELGARVGIIWFAINAERPRPSAFIYDFVIFAEYRRRGYGTQALAAMEEQVRALGAETIALHVFGHNHIAQALYKKTGYEVTGLHMTKQLNTATR